MATPDKPTRRMPLGPQVKIGVTTEIIKESIKRISSHCMIAEAVKACVPEATNVSVDVQTIRWSNRQKGQRYIFLTPRVAQDALIQFDQGQDVDPFEFMLRKAQVVKAGGQVKKLPHGGDVRPPKKAVLHVTDDGVPQRVGGKAPPLAGFARRREFGLRAYQR